MTKLIITLLLVICAVLIVLSRYLSWWLVLILCVILLPLSVMIVWWSIKHWVKKKIHKSLLNAARPLRGANVMIHELTEVPEPPHVALDEDFDDEDEDEDEDEENDQDSDRLLKPAWYASIDMTIQPTEERIEVKDDDEDDEIINEWTPSSFTLVPLGAVVKTGFGGACGWAEYPIATVATCCRVDVEDSTNSDSDDEDDISIEGPARVRAIFGIPEAMSGRVRLRYLTEELKEIDLPSRSSDCS